MWKEVTWCKLAEPGYAVLPFFAAAQCLGMLQRMGALPAWRLVWGAMEPSGLTWIWSCIGCLVFRNWFCKLFIDLELSNKRNSWKSCKWTACRTASCGHVGQETVPFHFKPCPSIWFFFFSKKFAAVTREHISQETDECTNGNSKSKWLGEDTHSLLLSFFHRGLGTYTPLLRRRDTCSSFQT